MNFIAIAGLCFSFLTSIMAVVAMLVTMKNNVSRLNERTDKQDQKEDAAAKELTQLLVLLKTFMAEQTQINKTVELGLTGVIRQLAEMEKRTVEASTVVSLLTEVLKKGSQFQIQP